MKKVFIILAAVFLLSDNKVSYAQTNGLEDEIKALESKIETTRATIAENDIRLENLIENQQQQLNILKSYADYKANRKKYNKDLEDLNSRADSLSNVIKSLEKEYAEDRKKLEKKVIDDRSKGERDVFLPLITVYTSHSFDELANSTTLESVSIDLGLLEDFKDVTPILNDLVKYHKAKIMLTKKFSESDVKKAISELNTVRESNAVIALQSIISRYADVNESVYNAVRVCDLDKNGNPWPVENTNNEKFMKMKYLKTLENLFSIVFSNDFKLTDYPYLSDIVLEVLKIKKYHPDADLSEIISRI